jgi:hypothetical protein
LHASDIRACKRERSEGGRGEGIRSTTSQHLRATSQASERARARERERDRAPDIAFGLPYEQKGVAYVLVGGPVVFTCAGVHVARNAVDEGDDVSSEHLFERG